MNNREAAVKLQRELLKLKLDDIVVPVIPGKKQPCVKHAGGIWNTSRLNLFLHCSNPDEYEIGILLHDLIVIDFDKKKAYVDLCARLLAEYNYDLTTAVTERTSKGFHVFFRRCKRVNDLGMFDGARTLTEDGVKLDIDIKTETRSVKDGKATGGLLVVAPSRGRRWEPGRSIFEMAPTEIPEPLWKWLKKVWKNSPLAKAPSARPPRAPTTPSLSKGSRRPDAEDDAEDARAEDGATAPERPQFDAIRYDIAGRARFRENGTLELKPVSERDARAARAALGDDPSFQVAGVWGDPSSRTGLCIRYKGVCPICTKHKHSNTFTCFWRGGSRLVIKSKSPKKCITPLTGEFQRAMVVPLPSDVLAEYQDDFHVALAAANATFVPDGTGAFIATLRAAGVPLSSKVRAPKAGGRLWVLGDTAYAEIRVHEGAPRSYLCVREDARACVYAEDMEFAIECTTTPFAPGYRDNIAQCFASRAQWDAVKRSIGGVPPT